MNLSMPTRTHSRCRVCGFTEIRTDEVIDRGVVFLAECLRCDHRWTSSEPLASLPTPRARPAARFHRVAARVAPPRVGEAAPAA